jgi:hypothetical protein
MTDSVPIRADLGLLMRDALDKRPIQQFCSEAGLPPLTSLVVNKNTGLPGEGFIGEANVPRDQSETFATNWLEIQAPTAEQLADAYTRAPDRGRRRARVDQRPRGHSL